MLIFKMGRANFKLLGVNFAFGKFARADEVCMLHFVKPDMNCTA